jgi:hypothetical protein
MRGIRITIVGAAALVAMLVGAYRLGAQDAAKALTFHGDIALWTVAIKPDKTADFEKVLARVRDALQKSENPQRKQQAAGWRVMRMEKALPDGNIAYVHMISPVVAAADYTILRSIYEEFPNESQPMYALYRDAFAQNLALATGSIVMDMSKPQP